MCNTIIHMVFYKFAMDKRCSLYERREAYEPKSRPSAWYNVGAVERSRKECPRFPRFIGMTMAVRVEIDNSESRNERQPFEPCATLRNGVLFWIAKSYLPYRGTNTCGSSLVKVNHILSCQCSILHHNSIVMSNNKFHKCVRLMQKKNQYSSGSLDLYRMTCTYVRM
jgi:hypothetical protein